MSLIRSPRTLLTLVILTLYMLLDGAYMLVRVPPNSASGVPTAEILILLYALTIIQDLRWMASFRASAPLLALACWWIVGSTRLIFDFLAHGIWALRDATGLIESLFLWIGFLVAANTKRLDDLFTWFKGVMIASVLVGMTYPIRTAIQMASPKIVSLVGIRTPLFFTYQLNHVFTILSALALVLSGRKRVATLSILVAGVLLVYIAATFQARTIYLQIVSLFLLLFALRRKEAIRTTGLLALSLAGGIITLAFALAFGLEIPGRLGQSASIEFFVDHFAAIWGGGSENAAVRGAAGGVSQRIYWWAAIWDNLTATTGHLFFGLGYGISLVALAHDETMTVAIREPHNSLVSSVGRLGIVGFGLYIWVHCSLFLRMFATYKLYDRPEETHERKWIAIMIGFCMLTWVNALGEDAFEKPFFAVPYYFLAGVVLNMYARRMGAAAKAVAVVHERLPGIMPPPSVPGIGNLRRKKNTALRGK